MFAALAFIISLALAQALAQPKILICSDSTTANYSSSDVLQGWGHFLHEYMSVPVINLAKNGRSARSFIREGLWKELLAKTVAGDFIVIEMGHNDDGDPSMNNSNHDKAGRSTLKGTGSETVIGPLKEGGTETVHTFGWYLRAMINDVKKRDGIALVSGMVPRNTWQSNGRFRHEWPMAKSAETVAREEKVEYIDHTKYTADRFDGLGEGRVKAFFPKDSTHTNNDGARLNAETFVTALKCARSKAASYIGPKGAALTQKC